MNRNENIYADFFTRRHAPYVRMHRGKEFCEICSYQEAFLITEKEEIAGIGKINGYTEPPSTYLNVGVLMSSL